MENNRKVLQELLENALAENEKDKEIEENIKLRKIMIRLAITSNLQGYHYILKAVEILKQQKIETKMTKIYEIIAKEYNSTKSAVERAIRHSIQRSTRKNNILKDIYGEIPDNSTFLYDLVFNFDIIQKECFK